MNANQRRRFRRQVIPTLVGASLETRVLPSQVTYHGGNLITNPEVQAVYYGSGWNTPANQALRGQIDGFLSYVVNSPFMDFLNQYNVKRGTFLGSKVYNATLHYSTGLGNYAADQLGFGRNTDQANGDIQNALANGIETGNLSTPFDFNHFYMVLLPPGATTTTCKSNDWAGYHDSYFFWEGTPGASSGYHVDYAVITQPSNFFGMTSPLDIYTTIISHELAEGTTDPEFLTFTNLEGQPYDTESGWWDGANGEEVGDLAEGTFGLLNGYVIQAIWFNLFSLPGLPAGATYLTKGNAAGPGGTGVDSSATAQGPIANPVSYQVSAGTTTVISSASGLLTTSTDPYGNQLSILVGQGPQHGDLVLNPDGSFSYAPSNGFVGNDQFTYRASDGHFLSPPATVTLTVARLQPAFSGLGSPSITFGTPGVTITGTVAVGDQAPQGESVNITLEGITRKATIGVGGAFSAMFDTRTLGVAGAPYTVSYAYAGDATYGAATKTSTLTVMRFKPTVTVSDAGGTYSGKPFPATATVADVNRTVSTTLEGVPLTLTYYAGNSAAGVRLAGPPDQRGTYTVVASFPGSSDYGPAVSTATFTIKPAVPSVSLNSSSNLTVYGQPAIFFAAVTSPGATPVGNVTFSDEGTILGIVPLDSAGHATLPTIGLHVGAHFVTASYRGDNDFTSASSGTVALSVTAGNSQPIPQPPQPILNNKKRAVSVGLAVQFGSIAAGIDPPSGTATFELILKAHGKARPRTKALGTSALVGGRASLSLKLQKVLNKTIEVTYGGDRDYQPSSTILPILTRQALKALTR